MRITRCGNVVTTYTPEYTTIEKVLTYEQTTGVAFGCPCLSEVLLAWSRL